MYFLTVFTPNKEIFETYYYGYGKVISQEILEPGAVKTVVDYGDDQYRCDYQAGRFASGLYHAEVEKM